MTGSSALAHRVGELRAQLESLGDLRPCDTVDALFTELVELCCATPPVVAEAAMSGLDAHAPALQGLCASGESALEAHWARRIVESDDPRAELDRFPYLDNYRDLVRMELGMVTAMSRPWPARVAVLGSGPLPLTGLILAEDFGAEVLHVDRDVGSLGLGDAVATALGVPRVAAGVRADLEQPSSASILLDAGLGRCDVVVLAALAGQDATAKRTISGLLARLLHDDALVLVRSAVRMRRLLYPQVRAEDLTGLRVALEVHPYTDIVNSVLVAHPGREGDT
ncbi:nicotianamine synthase family protein [Haloechinothrix sp. LS1_15]|uniref:nicotianamine synthase family protein n=1 Tax=Haloechinothrix sp. LS1_15 TaxID=2652248 RepID=UPI0029471BE3|nr:nicotianamine synthase family protein [Haloechinothrix sp. LS1_15]MDV6012904.1 nicotianamine synthase [Haloechinothrix sp. LS1_15]